MQPDFKLGVIGNPISHSLSPIIHQQFARQFHHQIVYDKYLVEADVEAFITSFFESGGNGLNITMPHKHAVMNIADSHTTAAKRCGAANTLSIDANGRIVADTTDGGGLLLDLEQKGFIKDAKRILIVGLGGASQSIIGALLDKDFELYVYNRSEAKVGQVIAQFAEYGKIKAYDPSLQMDGVISCVSEFNKAFFEPLTPTFEHVKFLYDLNYGQRASDFLNFGKRCGVRRTSDGLGMLLGQAALSYQIWTGKLPEIANVTIT